MSAGWKMWRTSMMKKISCFRVWSIPHRRVGRRGPHVACIRFLPLFPPPPPPPFALPRYHVPCSLPSHPRLAALWRTILQRAFCVHIFFPGNARRTFRVAVPSLSFSTLSESEDSLILMDSFTCALRQLPSAGVLAPEFGALAPVLRPSSCVQLFFFEERTTSMLTLRTFFPNTPYAHPLFTRSS
jgi:hypothetical protein